jgi:plastocyanin
MMRNSVLWTALLGAAMAYGTGCDGGDTGGGGSGGSTGGGGTSAGGNGGDGGGTTSAGGTGGTGGGTTSAGGMGGTGGMGGSGGTGGSMGNLVNGCDPATAEDHTADAVTTVTSSGFKYVPACIKISKGSSVTIASNFANHPLVGGVFANGMKMPDANSPITATSTGMEATFDFPEAGAFGYYCDFHAGSGMIGAVFVE